VICDNIIIATLEATRSWLTIPANSVWRIHVMNGSPAVLEYIR